MKKRYVVATRPSLLATTQTEQTVDLLRAKYPEIEFETRKFSTQGDKVTDKSLTEFGGTGVFVKELEMAIERGEADFAVHSLKDVPSAQPEDFSIVSFPKREDPRDIVLCRDNKHLKDLEANCTIGTSSPRRLVQIAAIKPQAHFKDIRGNIDTRMSKLENGEYDAIILAAAGLKRLGKSIDESAYLSIDQCVPAIGQGIIGMECRVDDQETIELLRSINHRETEICALAERKFMAVIGGGCKFPLAAHAVVNGNEMIIYTMIGDHFNNKLIRKTVTTTIDNSLTMAEETALSIKAEAESIGLRFNY